MSAIQQLPKPEQLVDLVGHAAAVHLAMTGAFDDKIKELKAATAALAEATEIADTVGKAKKILTKAETFEATARAQADAIIAEANDALDRAKSREATVSAREQAVSGRELAADQRQKAQDKREQAMLEASLSAATTIEARAVALKKNEDDYNARKTKLDADVRAFNQRLEALKV